MDKHINTHIAIDLVPKSKKEDKIKGAEQETRGWSKGMEEEIKGSDPRNSGVPHPLMMFPDAPHETTPSSHPPRPKGLSFRL